MEETDSNEANEGDLVRISPPTEQPREIVPSIKKVDQQVSKTEVLPQANESSVTPAATSSGTNQSPLEIATKVQQGISAASKVSNFFSLDTLQEDDAWMGAGTKGMVGMQNSEPFEVSASGYGVDDDSDDDSDEDGLTQPQLQFTTPTKTIAEEALEATKALGTASLALHGLEDLQTLVAEDYTPSDKFGKVIGADVAKVIQKKDKTAAEVWVPKYDREEVSVKIDEAQWRPPPPLPVVNPFQNTFDEVSIHSERD